MSETKHDAPRCHWCGGETTTARAGGAINYVGCRNEDCRAQGPIRPTPELAVAAYAEVTPKLRWTSEPPKERGRCIVQWMRDGKIHSVDATFMYGDPRLRFIDDTYCFYGPIPEPESEAKP